MNESILIGTIGTLGLAIGYMFGHITKNHKRELKAQDEHTKQIVSLTSQFIESTNKVSNSLDEMTKATEKNIESNSVTARKLDQLHTSIIKSMKKTKRK